MIIFGRRGAGKDLADEVDDGIATGSKFSNDLEFCGRIFVVWRLDGDEAKDFTQEGNSLADEVSGGQNILYLRGYGRASLVGGRAGRTGDQLGEGWRGERGEGCGDGERWVGEIILRQHCVHAALLCHESSSRVGGRLTGTEL